MIPASPIIADGRMTLTAARRALNAELKRLRQRFDADEDDWRYDLLRVYRGFSKAIGIEVQLLHPLETMVLEETTRIENSRRRKEGKRGTPMPFLRKAPLMMAAAAITVLRERGEPRSITGAVVRVAAASGIPRKEIVAFRQELNRDGYGTDVRREYQKLLAKIRGWPTDDLMAAISGIGKMWIKGL